MKMTKRILALLLCFVLVLGAGASALAYTAEEAEMKADALKAMDLFQGSDKGYELDRTPTRLEALIMLIRLSGKEIEAIYGEWECPFTDAPTWEGASAYLGFAAQNGLAQGVTDTTFDPNAPATAQMFITFVLRALGYDDTDNAVWNNWETLAVSAGLVESVEPFANGFTRADVVCLSFAALSCNVVGMDDTLANVLLFNGGIGMMSYYTGMAVVQDTALDADLYALLGEVYAGVDKVLPARMYPALIATDDPEYFEFAFGTTSFEYEEAIICEPMMTSVAHSVGLVRVKDGTDIEAAKAAIKNGVDPRKWICVSVEPENIRVENIGNLILLVMDNQAADEMVANFLALAE